MRIYLAGNITDRNRKAYQPTYEALEAELASMGHEVVNPISLTPKMGGSSSARVRIINMMSCDMVYIVSDFQDEKNIKEKVIADIAGIPVVYSIKRISYIVNKKPLYCEGPQVIHKCINQTKCT